MSVENLNSMEVREENEAYGMLVDAINETIIENLDASTLDEEVVAAAKEIMLFVPADVLQDETLDDADDLRLAFLERMKKGMKLFTQGGLRAEEYRTKGREIIEVFREVMKPEVEALCRQNHTCTKYV